jgi:hypothetical protein
MSRLLPWLTVALLSVVFPSIDFAAPDGRPPAKPAAKPADNPFAANPAAQTAKLPKNACNAPMVPARRKAPAPQGPKPSRNACPSAAQKGPCKELRTGAAIKQALAEKARFEFSDTPLCDLIEFIKDQHKLAIQLDKKALDDVGVAPDVPITCNIEGISLCSALKLVLHNLGLTFQIWNEVLMITTPEQAESRLEIVVYDVADLVTCRDEKGELWEDFDQLIETITSTVKPTTWDSVGGPGSIAPGTYASAKVLVIAQTGEVHELVAALLEKIRDVVKQNGGKSEPPRRSRPERPAAFGMGGSRVTGGGKLSGAGAGQFGSGGKPATKP